MVRGGCRAFGRARFSRGQSPAARKSDRKRYRRVHRLSPGRWLIDVVIHGERRRIRSAIFSNSVRINIVLYFRYYDTMIFCWSSGNTRNRTYNNPYRPNMKIEMFIYVWATHVETNTAVARTLFT